jgi:TRAP transporter 4TM/12TM fusion protein
VTSNRHFLSTLVPPLLVLGAIAHLVQVYFFVTSAWEFQSFHLGFALTVIFLSMASTAAGRNRRVGLLVLAVLSTGMMVYVLWQYDRLIATRMFSPSAADIAVSVALVLLTLLATTLQWGFTLPALATVAILYAYFGNYIPGDLFFHSGIELERLTSYLAIPSFQGVLGSLTGLSATTVFIFMLYVGALSATGGVSLILSLGTALAGKSRSSPALMSIFSSAFMGMLSGSTVANVASTGTMTIPLMKRSGFKAEEAGAIEAVASLGGQFTPPIMGLTAFLIVGITGIPYTTIVVAAILPAIVFYGYLASVVHFRARCQELAPRASGLVPELGRPDVLPLGRALREHGHLLVSLALLVYLLAIQEPPSLAAAYAIVAIMAAELVNGFSRERGARGWGLLAAARKSLRGLEEGALLGAQLAVILATIGILTDVVVVTGFAQKLSFLILNMAGGSLFVILALSALACLVFGLGLPTPAAYVLVALFGVPALLDAGTPLLHAHMFVFYFANMSAITPPVALAPLVASKIAGGSYFKTCLVALRLGLPGFLLPFLFAYFPNILIHGSVGLGQVSLALCALAAVVTLNAVATGNFLWPLAPWERGLFFLAFLGFLTMDWKLASAGAIVVAAVASYRSTKAAALRRLPTNDG